MDMVVPYEWLTSPVMLHSSRAHECTMTAAQCAFKSRRWVNWYYADLVYGRAAVYFFTATIGVFAAAYALGRLLPRAARRHRAWLALLALARSLSYPGVRLARLRYNAPSLGVCLLLGAGAVFFTGVALGPRPYYWPNTRALSYGDSPPLATRAGYLSLGCLPFILAFGAKANLVTAVTGVAPEKLVVFHLFAAWGMFVLALLHTFPFVVYHAWAGDLVATWRASAMWLTGVVALLAQAWLTVMSLPFVRHRAYEFFKACHLAMAAVFAAFLFIHVDYTLTSWDYLIAAAAVYLASLSFAVARTYLAHGRLHARLVLQSDQTLRIAVPVGGRRRGLQWRPGQHLYLRFVALGAHALTAHPFTICSADSELVFYAKPRGGVTARLARLARKQPGVVVPVFIEGPYGGVPHRWDEGFDTTVVVAGGAGAGFSLGLVEDWLRSPSESESSLLAVVSSRDPGMRRWFVEALHQLADKHAAAGRLPHVRVVLHETGPAAAAATVPGGRGSGESSRALAAKDSGDVTSGHSSTEALSEKSEKSAPVHEITASAGMAITYHQGQADLPALVREACSVSGSHVGIAVCGPSSMAHDVAAACGAEQRRILGGGPGAAEVWLHQEAFTN